MPIPQHRDFPHRHNRNGSFDSICPCCFHTIATRSNEDDLVRDERLHTCNDWDLDWYKPAVAKPIVQQQ